MLAALAFCAVLQQPMTKLEEQAAFHNRVTGMSAKERSDAFRLRQILEAESPFSNLTFRNVGPEIQGGRIVDLAIPGGKPASLYVAFATGGFWRTDNNGTTWESLFDKYGAFGIGDFDCAGADGEIIYLGTGESNSSRTSYAGNGVYKSVDSGKNWIHLGLDETQHIGRVLIHPKNPNVVYVAAIGHLYSWNKERGVFKTTDAGKSWEHVLAINERTGVIDLVMDPRNPEILYAAAWERDRRAWNFLESGPGSGIYKSTNGGRTWKKLTGGLPEGQYVGRIGLAISKQNPNLVYCVVDNHAHRSEAGMTDERVPAGQLTLRRLKMMTEAQLLEVERPILVRFFGEEFRGVKLDEILQMIRDGKLKIADLLRQFGDANEALFDTDIVGAEVYSSKDGGANWTKTHENRINDLFSTYGYYFGQIIVSPVDDKEISILGVPALRSLDGGKSFKQIIGGELHSDHHALVVDPRWPNRAALGNDGGLNLSWDGGKSWADVKNLPVGQFTTIAVDNARPYRIYGGLQDNGTMRGSANYVPGNSDPWEWESIGGGDGSCVVVDPRDNETTITASQFGFAFRRNRENGQAWGVMPSTKLMENRLRFNWVTPFMLSPHHADILYYGANILYRSFDQGRTFVSISPDLTGNPKVGDVPFGTITTISESPKRFGLIYVGTDSGNIQRTVNGGSTWNEIGFTTPSNKWVSRVVASAHEEGRVYVAKSGYREDDFTAYLYRSDDYGNSWKEISVGLPNETINVIREDPLVNGLIYVGTDMGVFVSFDKGENWFSMVGGLPHVAIHDLAVQRETGDLVLGTHGRSAWVCEAKWLRMLTESVRDSDLFVFPLSPLVRRQDWGYDAPEDWENRKADDPSVRVAIWQKEAGALTIRLLDSKGTPLKTMKYRDGKDAERGLNFVDFSLMLQPGKPIPPNGIDWKPKTISEILSDPFLEYRPKYPDAGEYSIEVQRGERSEKVAFSLRKPN